DVLDLERHLSVPRLGNGLFGVFPVAAVGHSRRTAGKPELMVGRAHDQTLLSLPGASLTRIRSPGLTVSQPPGAARVARRVPGASVESGSRPRRTPADGRSRAPLPAARGPAAAGPAAAHADSWRHLSSRPRGLPSGVLTLAPARAEAHPSELADASGARW